MTLLKLLKGSIECCQNCLDKESLGFKSSFMSYGLTKKKYIQKLYFGASHVGSRAIFQSKALESCIGNILIISHYQPTLLHLALPTFSV